MPVRQRDLTLAGRTADPQQVVARQDAGSESRFESSPGHGQRVIGGTARYPAILELIFLIAVHGIEQKVREVVEHMQLVVDEEPARRQLPLA